MQQISPASYLASLSEQERETWLASLTDKEKAELAYNWDFWARPDQKAPPGDWFAWLILAGRGWGKTRTGAEWVRELARDYPGCRIALVAETAADARDVMIKGDSGLLSVDPTLSDESWSPTNRCVTWPNGSKAWTYNATEPDQLRGPQHHFAWVDELAKFRYDQAMWDQIVFGLRLGDQPRVLITTTPQPKKLIKNLAASEHTHVTRGATKDNLANLARSAVEQMYDRYEGTRLGRQELEGEILGDIPGALWTRESIDDNRLQVPPEDLERVFVAVDPATSSEEGSDEHGIVVVALARDEDGYARGYVLEDASLRGTPEEWSKKAVHLYRKWSADKIIAEKNQGGEMVSFTIKSVDRSVPVELVHASRGKVVRAEPISALYEQGRIHHVGRHDKLEDQMCEFSVDNVRNASTGSPDRVDALVWGLTKIFDKIAGRRQINKAAQDGTTITTYAEHANQHSHTGWMAG